MGDAQEELRGHLPEGFDPIPPEPFGKYTLVARVGTGGMAAVFLAIAAGPAGFRKLVVIKRLLEHLEDDQVFVRMFLDEARLAARLNHPNVVQTLEVGAVGDSHFLAMEYLEGQTFGRVMGRFRSAGRPMPIPIAAHVASEVLEGLHYAHTLEDFDGTPLNVVHRDISPTNVMITYDGVIKIVDFGIAKAKTQDEVTDPDQKKGKFAYIAPEQALDHFDARADLFSLGIVLWEAVSGKRLFYTDNPADTLQKTLTMPIPLLSEAVGRPMPKGLDQVVARALEREPDKRFQSAREMQVALDEVMRTAKGIVRKSDIQRFMGKVFEDVREAHGRALKQCVEMGLDSATAMFEVLDPLATPRLVAHEEREDAETGELRERRPRATRRVWLGAGLGGLAASAAFVLLLSSGDAETEAVDPRAVAAAVEAVQPEPPDAAPSQHERDLAEFERQRELGLGHFRAGRFREAADAYRTAAYHNPAHSGVHAALGASLLRLEDSESAVEAYQEAVRLAPTHSGYHAALGRAYRLAGRDDLAAESFRQALRLDPDNRAATRAIEELDAN